MHLLRGVVVIILSFHLKDPGFNSRRKNSFVHHNILSSVLNITTCLESFNYIGRFPGIRPTLLSNVFSHLEPRYLAKLVIHYLDVHTF